MFASHAGVGPGRFQFSHPSSPEESKIKEFIDQQAKLVKGHQDHPLNKGSSDGRIIMGSGTLTSRDRVSLSFDPKNGKIQSFFQDKRLLLQPDSSWGFGRTANGELQTGPGARPHSSRSCSPLRLFHRPIPQRRLEPA